MTRPLHPCTDLIIRLVLVDPCRTEATLCASILGLGTRHEDGALHGEGPKACVHLVERLGHVVVEEGEVRRLVRLVVCAGEGHRGQQVEGQLAWGRRSEGGRTE